jgi:hypothetical protein
MAVTVGYGEGGREKGQSVGGRKEARIVFEIGASEAAGGRRSRGSKVSGMPRLRVVPSRSEGGHPG